jgi:hypothetical protein
MHASSSMLREQKTSVGANISHTIPSYSSIAAIVDLKPMVIGYSILERDSVTMFEDRSLK